MPEEDIKSIDEYRVAVLKLLSHDVKYERYSKEFKPHVCRHILTIGLSKLLNMLGFTCKLETYYSLAVNKSDWPILYRSLKYNEKEVLQIVYKEFQQLSKLSGFLFDPINPE